MAELSFTFGEWGVARSASRSGDDGEFHASTVLYGCHCWSLRKPHRQWAFEVNGEAFQVSTNQAGNCLHGGEEGFDKRRWNIESQSEQQVTFSLLSEDGDQGFPGNLEVHVTYTLTDDNQVSIAYFAKTDKATPVNLTNHAYFNLLGAEADLDCRSHRLTIAADQYLPTNDVGIPLGALQDVKGTGFDFRNEKPVSEHFLQDEQQIAAKGYDHSYLFDAHRDVSKPVARVVSPDGKVHMSVVTNKPAMQLYTGNWLAGAPNRRGGEYQDYAGLALETQFCQIHRTMLSGGNQVVFLNLSKRIDSVPRFTLLFS